MTQRQFTLGLVATFGLAWATVVVIPFFLARHPKPVEFTEIADGKTGIYHPKTTGRIRSGAEVYAENGCANCHTQVIRPLYAGSELARSDWAGLKADDERGDTRRASTVYDYLGSSYAPIGMARMGPDLSNFGRRVEKIYAGKDGVTPRQWVFQHLYNPRHAAERADSKCPPFAFLFEEKRVTGQVLEDALPVAVEREGYVVVPSAKAESLVEYLLSLKRDDTLPAVINPAPVKPQG